MTQPRGSAWIRARRDELVGADGVRGRDFGVALSATIDEAVASVLAEVGTERVAVLAMGSYARRELCPGSDLDILLLHDRRSDIATVADAMWYPLWDAGFVLGNATRTTKESLQLAEKDLDTLTGLLELRFVGGDLVIDAARLTDGARTLALRRRSSLIPQLADAAMLRRLRPGRVAEMLEPNLKDGAGGLRDLHALVWAGWATALAGGHAALTESGILRPEDAAFLDAAGSTLLDVRVGLHRVTGGRSDVLALQDQDAVAAKLAYVDADSMVRDLAATARRVAWIADDTWTRLRGAPRRRGAMAVAAQLASGVVEHDGRIGVAVDAVVDGALLLRVARAAAVRSQAIDRSALAALRDAPTPEWTAETRADFLAVLRSSSGVIDTFEALDHEDLVTRILPEWANVRFRPQRNAYHRFTVDRHLLETVSEAGVLLDDPAAPEAHAADAVEHPELLLLGALLHDIAKGQPGDHAVLGAAVARVIGTRLQLAAEQIEVLVWLVQDHLLMADTATRRDLSDPATIRHFSERVGDPERLRLLTLLTVADSRATGPAAWGSGKAALVRELYDRTLAAWCHEPVGDQTDSAIPPAVEVTAEAMAGTGVVVQWAPLDDRRLRCIVGAPDRPGLLASVAGALTLEGFDIASAEVATLADGRAGEVFIGSDRFDRLGDDAGRDRAAATIRGVLAGEISVVEALRERRAAYASATVEAMADEAVRVRIAQDESDDATVVEVFAPDQIGLLATIAKVFADLRLEVTVARVATTGEQAVDVFYVHDQGEKVTDVGRVDALRAALLASVQRD